MIFDKQIKLISLSKSVKVSKISKSVIHRSDFYIHVSSLRNSVHRQVISTELFNLKTFKRRVQDDIFLENNKKIRFTLKKVEIVM